MIGGVEIRDYNQNGYQNTITCPCTTEVYTWNSGSKRYCKLRKKKNELDVFFKNKRLDSTRWVLPPSWWNDILGNEKKITDLASEKKMFSKKIISLLLILGQ